MIHIFLATGFEEIEALTPLDVLRRCALDVRLVSITGEKIVEGSHGVKIEADVLFEEAQLDGSEALIIPGGLPGAQNLLEHAALREALKKQNARNGLICAICAGPMVLGVPGLLQGKKVTCYPGFENRLAGANYTARLVEEDGHVITGRGPGAAMEFAFAIAGRFVRSESVRQLRKDMIVD